MKAAAAVACMAVAALTLGGCASGSEGTKDSPPAIVNAAGWQDVSVSIQDLNGVSVMWHGRIRLGNAADGEDCQYTLHSDALSTDTGRDADGKNWWKSSSSEHTGSGWAGESSAGNYISLEKTWPWAQLADTQGQPLGLCALSIINHVSDTDEEGIRLNTEKARAWQDQHAGRPLTPASRGAMEVSSSDGSTRVSWHGGSSDVNITLSPATGSGTP